MPNLSIYWLDDRFPNPGFENCLAANGFISWNMRPVKERLTNGMIGMVIKIIKGNKILREIN